MKKILIIGATSAIAHATARIWATQAAEFMLVGRDEAKLRQNADDLIARGASRAQIYVLNITQVEQHPHLLQHTIAQLGMTDIALIAHGTLPDQTMCEADATYALREFNNNGLSVIAFLTQLANQFAAQKQGTIAVISSVAGDRGRPSNYLYGSAKAAVNAFCEGLRARLHPAGVHVLTIKPGFVATPMTQGLDLPQRLVASPETVASSIVNAIQKKRNTIYTPWFWWGIMTIIRLIPTAIFKKLKL
jgi:decaprenylphospho-beta-D-erythro-pentofuranosid-2-ulose 2-reductase